MAPTVPLLAIPNVSEGRDPRVIARLVDSVRAAGALVLDVHSDPTHNRTVITTCGSERVLVDSMVALAKSCAAALDLHQHVGVHPRVGVLDVCPFVPWTADRTVAIAAAHGTAERIAGEARIPVYLYGYASRGPIQLELSDLRRGGLAGLRERAVERPPDAGRNHAITEEHGVVCVGGRDPLIAFNVWMRGSLETARALAGSVRSLDGIRALGLDLGDGQTQVSMNLTRPDTVGIVEAFDFLERAASDDPGMEIVRTELVGLAFQRHLPDPDATAARLMDPPGRSFESALEDLLASS